MLTPLASTSRQTAKSASHSAGGSAAEGSSRTSREIAPWVSSSARAIVSALRSTAFSSATGRSTSISTSIRPSSSRVRRRCRDQAILPGPRVAKPETRPTFSVAVSSPIRPRSWWTKRRPRRRASSAEFTSQRLAVDQHDAARIGVVEAGEALDQGRLAGAVLTDQRVDLGLADLEGDVLQGALPGEGLREVLDLDQRLRRRRRVGLAASVRVESVLKQILSSSRCP